MIDRFGLLPVPVKRLFATASLRLQATQCGVQALELGDAGGHIEFREDTRVDPLQLVTLVQEQPQRYRLSGPTRLRIDTALPSPGERESLGRDLLQRLSGQLRDAA